jgi:hypothetical protein
VISFMFFCLLSSVLVVLLGGGCLLYLCMIGYKYVSNMFVFVFLRFVVVLCSVYVNELGGEERLCFYL